MPGDRGKTAGSAPAMLPALPRLLANALVDKAIRYTAAFSLGASGAPVASLDVSAGVETTGP